MSLYTVGTLFRKGSSEISTQQYSIEKSGGVCARRIFQKHFICKISLNGLHFLQQQYTIPNNKGAETVRFRRQTNQCRRGGGGWMPLAENQKFLAPLSIHSDVLPRMAAQTPVEPRMARLGCSRPPSTTSRRGTQNFLFPHNGTPAESPSHPHRTSRQTQPPHSHKKAEPPMPCFFIPAP